MLTQIVYTPILLFRYKATLSGETHPALQPSVGHCTDNQARLVAVSIS